MKNVEVNFESGSAIFGGLAALCLVGASPLWILLLAPIALCTFKFKGFPYLRIVYQSGFGWKVEKGRY